MQMSMTEQGSSRPGGHYMAMIHDGKGNYLPLNDPFVSYGTKAKIEEVLKSDNWICKVWGIDFD